MTETKESKAMQVANWLTEKAVGGVGPLSSAEDLALEYLNNPDYEDNDARVESLINWETTKKLFYRFYYRAWRFCYIADCDPGLFGRIVDSASANGCGYCKNLWS